jgi:hypothetical protein
MDRTVSNKSKSSITERLNRIAQSEGLVGLARRVISRGKNAFGIRRFYLYYYALRPDLPILPVKADVQFEVIDRLNEEAIAEVAGMVGATSTYQVMKDRLDRDELCYIATAGSKVVSYFWIRLAGQVNENRLTVYTLAPTDVYIHDAYTLPEYRGKNIYPAMKTIAGREAAAKYGKQRMISIIERNNQSSLKSTWKIGETYIGYIGWMKIFGKRFPFKINR